jgi:hypothetical protein
LQNAIAIASVAATAAVAIAVPLVTARTERVRIRGQLQHDRLDELRSVLDLAALALSRAEETLKFAELAVERSQASDAVEHDASAAEAAIGAADQALQEVSAQWVRTSIRLGPETEIVTSYCQAYQALVEELEVLTNAFQGGPLSDDPQGWKEVVVPLNHARQSFEKARHAVSELAAQLIGPFSSAGMLDPKNQP